MASADMCEHDWPGSGCRDCRINELKAEVEELKKQQKEDWENINTKADAIDHWIDTSAKQHEQIEGLKLDLANAHNNAVRLAANQVIAGDTVTNTQRRILSLLIPAQRGQDILPVAKE